METDQPSILTRNNRPSIAYRSREGRMDIPGVVYLTGFRSAMSGDKVTAVDQFCAAQSQCFVRFDYTGHGVSAGTFEDGTIGAWLEDSIEVIDRLTTGPQILVGSSMGGWLALLAALARPDRVDGLVLIAPAPDFTQAFIWDVMTDAQREQLLTDGEIRVPSNYDPNGYVITRALVEEGRRHLLLDAPLLFAGPVRILHGTGDREIPWQHSLRLMDALTSKDVAATFVKGAPHRLSEPEDLKRLLSAIEDVTALVKT